MVLSTIAAAAQAHRAEGCWVNTPVRLPTFLYRAAYREFAALNAWTVSPGHSYPISFSLGGMTIEDSGL